MNTTVTPPLSNEVEPNRPSEGSEDDAKESKMSLRHARIPKITHDTEARPEVRGEGPKTGEEGTPDEGILKEDDREIIIERMLVMGKPRKEGNPLATTCPSLTDNAYKLDLSTAYGEEFDSRMNPFEEGGNDRNPTDKDKDNLHDTGGPMTKSKTKMLKQSLLGLSLGIKENLEQSESETTPKWVTLSQLMKNEAHLEEHK
ncbi:hypothetical protein CR513_29853, partial [Mucuna pruriens]